jgi:hypothetical protein
MTLTFQVKEFGRTFATRERGNGLRGELLKLAEGHDVVVVDFDGVMSVSYSFADELVGKLCADEPIHVELRNLSPRVQEIVDRAVARRAQDSVAC